MEFHNARAAVSQGMVKRIERLIAAEVKRTIKSAGYITRDELPQGAIEFLADAVRRRRETQDAAISIGR